MFPKPEKQDILRLSIVFSITILLISPPILSLTDQKMYYDDGTMVITQPLIMEIESGDDIFYGQNNFSAVLVFYNMEYINYSYESQIQHEFSKADIHINFVRVWINETAKVYTDVEFEDKMDDIRKEYNADFISVFANMKPNEDKYPNLIGFANLKYHFSIVFCSKLQSPIDMGAVQTHEIGHLMGLHHVKDASCLMYDKYLYTNRNFCEVSIETLYTLHH